MKKILPVFFVIGACTQNVTSPTSNTGTITFDANGQHIEYSGSYATIANNSAGVYGIKSSIVHKYNLNGQKGANSVCFFTINTDTLEEKLYDLHPVGTGQVGIEINGALYQMFYDTQNFMLDIAQHSGGRLNATFNGTLYHYVSLADPGAGVDSILVTNGEINNMEMIY